MKVFIICLLSEISINVTNGTNVFLGYMTPIQLNIFVIQINSRDLIKTFLWATSIDTIHYFNFMLRERESIF